MLRTIWRKYIAERVSHAVSARIWPRFEAATVSQLQALQKENASLGQRLAGAEERINQLLDRPDKPWLQNLHPSPIALHPKMDSPFMAFSTCSASDFLHPEFERMARLLGLSLEYHRKFWEWVFILHHGLKSGAVAPGKRALGFAVGTEPLPSAFAAAGADVVATDAPADVGVGTGWKTTGEYASQVADLHKPDILDAETFFRRVTYRPCDMTALPADLAGFDLCWSACSFEHLGSIAAGLDFVQESVETTLKPGGVAIHTTEFNWSSDTNTVTDGPTVLYRRSDLLAFIDRMERRGHRVEPLRIAPDTHTLDSYVDTPPYSMPVHLKLKLLGFVSTSVGLVITRGR